MFIQIILNKKFMNPFFSLTLSRMAKKNKRNEQEITVHKFIHNWIMKPKMLGNNAEKGNITKN